MDFLTIITLFVGIAIAYILLGRNKTTKKTDVSIPSTSESKPVVVEKTAIVEKTEQPKLEEDGCCGGGGESCACRESKEDDENSTCCSAKTPNSKSIKILYASQTGTSIKWANEFATQATQKGFNPVVVDLSTYDLDDLSDENIVVFFASSYTGGKLPDSCIPFFDWLDAHSLDWRVDKVNYSKVKYAVFGIGHSVYGENFNKAARNIDEIMHRLTALRLAPVGLGDNGAGVEVETAFVPWSSKFWRVAELLESASPKSRNQIATSEEPDEDPEADPQGEPLVDMEDLGNTKKKVKKPVIKRRSKKNGDEQPAPKKVQPEEMEENMNDEDDDDDEEEEVEVINADGTVKEREMLTPSLRKALTKQGYRLLGSHSGVKLCRWTKAMLRGRGGCYKHTFYGIKSYQCMEMTPSLACANKCVFCWRHHKNPVGTEWKWKTDEAGFLLDEAIKQHQSMIKQMKGVPGVSKERYDEAFTIKHCALSLVGEPITYPEINKFCDMLHGRGISSFMVTNAQFPDKIDELKPVTQLYISVDAATKESLQKIDRPIFPDFWERFLACMDSLAKKGQRTVYRLTLVKEWNMDEIKNYAQLIERGKPSFVEVKGVTYCGTSKASTLTMQNVPFHQEVINFATALCQSPELRDDYELAVEHEHSCGVLIAHKKFKVNGIWNTWIDYPKFHELVSSGKEFNATDYMEPTPYWALFGAQEKGFDPDETRFKRNKPYQTSGC